MNKLQCVCKTGPKGNGPQCKKNAVDGYDLCAIHLKKCHLKDVQAPKSPSRPPPLTAAQLMRRPPAAPKTPTKRSPRSPPKTPIKRIPLTAAQLMRRSPATSPSPPPKSPNKRIPLTAAQRKSLLDFITDELL
jgi:hypothetical protein